MPSEAERKMCGLSDVDIPATIRTCVERGSHMEKDGLQGQIMPEDLRMKRYRNKKHSTVLLLWMPAGRRVRTNALHLQKVR